MPEFKYDSTIASGFYFNVSPAIEKVSGEVTVTTSIGVPKDLEKRKHVRCDVSVEVLNKITGEKDIKVKTTSFFGIASGSDESNLDKLVDDASEYCIPIALEETDRMISKAAEILIGQQVVLQLSRRFKDVEDGE